jgi:hypothetical protein
MRGALVLKLLLLAHHQTLLRASLDCKERISVDVE